MTSLVKTLSSHPVFSSLDEDTIEHLAKSSIERSYEKKTTIVRTEEIWPYFFLVVDGSVEAVKASPEGRNLLVGIFNSGDLFWGLAFFRESAPMPVTLQTDQPSRINIWSKEILQPVIFQNGKLLWEISCVMVDNMMRASGIVDSLAFQPVAGRVAQFLLEEYPSDHTNLPRNLTLDEMAARTGTTREMVCRFLQQFANNGAIEITRTEFAIINRQKLENIAKK
jgi:CRP/FNR family transcriptional regulator